MKPATKRKLQAKALRKAYPHMTLEAIGDRIGVSAGRVHQILRETDLPTKSNNGKSKTCVICGTPTRSGIKTCSVDCRKQLYYTTATCALCGVEKEVQRSKMKQAERRKHANFFCSREHYYEFRNA